MKNRKNNWIKIVIQLLSFILIPELFVTGFTAIGDIFSPDLCWKYFLGECQVFGVCTNRDSARKCTGGGDFFADFSAALELCRISCGLQRGSWEKAAGGGTEIQKYTRKLTEF